MNRESTLKLIKRAPIITPQTQIEDGNVSAKPLGDIEDTVTIIKSGCPFYYGYSTDTAKFSKPDKSINYVA